jgi:diguanylate cyclase (GGDEF)-like protein
MADAEDPPADAVRLRAEFLERLMKEYALETRAVQPVHWGELLGSHPPVPGEQCDVLYVRTIWALGGQDLLGPRLAARFFEAGGRRAAKYLRLRDVGDIALVLNGMMPGHQHVVEWDGCRLVLEGAHGGSCEGADRIGLPMCVFEAGFVAGALERLTGKTVAVRETKCWGLGDGVCRFEAEVGGDEAHEGDALEVVAGLAARAAEAADLLRLLKEREAELERLARTDYLTGLANRRVLYQALEHEIERFKRYDHPVSLLLADIDHFKALNDTLGHQAGDQALAAVAEVLRANARKVDVAARFGGEEFAIVLGDTPGERAVMAAERLRTLIAELEVVGAHRLTVSIGVASVPPAEADVDALVAAVDAALYEAKQAGRNRVAARI